MHVPAPLQFVLAFRPHEFLVRYGVCIRLYLPWRQVEGVHYPFRQELGAIAFSSFEPGLPEGFGAAVFGIEPAVPLLTYLGLVRFHYVGKLVLCGKPCIDYGVLVGEFHHADGRIVLVGNAGVGIDMLQDFLVETFLELDHPGIDIVNAVLVVRQQMGVLEPVRAAHLAGDVQLEVNVDAVFLELGEEIVEALELHRLDEGILHGISAFRGTVAHVMHAYEVDSVAREFLRQPVSILVPGEASGHAKIGTYEADFPARTVHETVPSCGDESVGTGLAPVHARPRAHVCDIVRSGVRRLEGKKRRETARRFNLFQDFLIPEGLLGMKNQAAECGRK